jgi:hypothetical protein
VWRWLCPPEAGGRQLRISTAPAGSTPRAAGVFPADHNIPCSQFLGIGGEEQVEGSMDAGVVGKVAGREGREVEWPGAVAPEIVDLGCVPVLGVH